MSKGNLIHTSHSDLNSAIELLDRLGVTYDDFDRLKKASSWQQMITAAVLQSDQYLLNLLALGIPAKKAGFSAEEVATLAGKENLLRDFRNVLLGNAEIKMFDFWRVLENLEIKIPGLPHPKLEGLQNQHPFIKKIIYDVSPTEELVLWLGTVLRPDEDYIVGEEYQRRLKPRLNLTGGYQQAVWLVEHQDEFPALMPLLGKVYIDFPGLVVLGADGGRRFPCLCRHGERWYLYWCWASSSLRRHGRVASK